MLEWIRKIVAKIKYHLSHEWCYDRMEADGIAAMGCCCGIVGGAKATGYLPEDCISCPHWVPIEPPEEAAP